MESLCADAPSVELSVCSTAEEGVELAKVHRPDLVLLDINLPNMNGFEALVQLRGIQGFDDVPIVALSSDALPAQIKKAHSAGFTDYLTKPLNIDKFLNLIFE